MDSLIVFLQIMFINVLLSGDNAVVIALASQQLPPSQRRKAVYGEPWRRSAALRAHVDRVVPAASALSAGRRERAAVHDCRQAHHGCLGPCPGISYHAQSRFARQAPFGPSSSRDFIMSLDNVLAIAAVAAGRARAYLARHLLSIPMIIWGSQILSNMLRKFPSLVYIGGGLLGYASGEMLVHDPAIHRIWRKIGRADEGVPRLLRARWSSLWLCCE